MQENQQVVFLSDGGDTVRQLQEYLHPCSEHLIDWFHITMRLTVLRQQAKGLQAERPQFGQKISKQLESVKHLLWHGNTEEALERIGGLNIELDLLRWLGRRVRRAKIGGLVGDRMRGNQDTLLWCRTAVLPLPEHFASRPHGTIAPLGSW